MYEALVARVRYHIQKANFMGLKEADSTMLLGEAADAIEEQQSQIDGWIEQERNALLKSIPKWIPVTERLPEWNENVLIYSAHSGLIRIDANIQFDRNATHWMPLPTPPTEEEGKG